MAYQLKKILPGFQLQFQYSLEKRNPGNTQQARHGECHSGSSFVYRKAFRELQCVTIARSALNGMFSLGVGSITVALVQMPHF